MKTLRLMLVFLIAAIATGCDAGKSKSHRRDLR